MDDHFFVCYSRADAKELGPELADQLAAGTPSYRSWVDVKDIDPGEDWDDQVEDAITHSRGLLLVMTLDSVRRHSECKNEWVWALKFKKPVVPLLFDPNASLPLRLSSRQYIDFTENVEQGLAKLRIFIGELHEPKGHLRELRFQLADAERDLARTLEPGQRARVEEDIAELRRRISELSDVADDPTTAVEATRARIDAGLEQVREPERPQSVTHPRAKFINPPPVTAPSYFQDRHSETQLLAEFLADPGVRLVTVVGRGGIGKTAMVCRLLKAMEAGRLPDDLGECDIDGIVYLRTQGEHPASFANLFNDLCRLLPEKSAERLAQRYRDGHETPAALMSALLEEFPTDKRDVVLLDNFEDLLDDDGAITDTALSQGLFTLVSAPAHGVVVILTSRVPPQPLLLHQPGGHRAVDLDDGLPSPYAERILRARDPDGRLGLRDASDAILGALRERTRGYPRALEALSAILSADRDTTLAELMEQTEELPDNVVEALVGQAFHRLDSLAQHVLQALAIFPVPVPAVAIDFVLQAFLPTINAAPVLTRLVNMQFVRSDGGRYHLHQVDRDYALAQVPVGQPEDRDVEPPPFTQFVLRDRAATYFTQTQTPREEWKTLDDLAPQFAEFELRVQGGDYDTAAYVLDAIDEEYLVVWGHYRLVLDQHARLQGHLTDPTLEWMGTITSASCYFYIGEHQRARELYELGQTMAQRNDDRAGVGYAKNGLALCLAASNEVEQAITAFQAALATFEEIGDEVGQATVLTNLANRYSGLGQFDAAIELHARALKLDRSLGFIDGEASDLNNLGGCYIALGMTEKAARSYERALALYDTVDFPYGRGGTLIGLAEILAGQGKWKEAADRLSEAGQIGESTMLAQIRADSLVQLAWVQVAMGNPSTGAVAADGAVEIGYLPSRVSAACVQGVTRLLRKDSPGAEEALGKAVSYADDVLATNGKGFATLDEKGIALTALTLAGGSDRSEEAAAAFTAARTIADSPGVIAEVVRRLDALAPVDDLGIVPRLREAASVRQDA